MHRSHHTPPLTTGIFSLVMSNCDERDKVAPEVVVKGLECVTRHVNY